MIHNTLITNDLNLFNEVLTPASTISKVTKQPAIREVKTQTESFLFIKPSTHGRRIRNQKLRTERKKLLKLIKNQAEIYSNKNQIGFSFVLPLFNVAPIQPQKTEKVKRERKQITFTECNQINLF